VITHLDEDGYLKATLEDLVQVARAELEDIEAEEITIAIRQIQNLEPAGVGACDLSECLALQLKALAPSEPQRERAIELVTRHLDALASRDYNKLKRQLGIDEDELREVRAHPHARPKPGRGLGRGDVRYVVPDVTVGRRRRWLAQLSRDAMPRLRINKMYADLLQSSRDSGRRTSPGSCRRRAG
jgi:RNA polymerase sigma-54 factor